MRPGIYLICYMPLLLSACTGNTLLPKNSNEIPVSSEPSGAQVFVMGKPVGNTPLRVNVNDVFPVTYTKEELQYYGYIVLRSDDCDEKKVRVSGRVLSDGLKVRLDCPAGAGREGHVQAVPEGVRSVGQRLNELRELRKTGLISEEEYQQIRTRILESI